MFVFFRTLKSKALENSDALEKEILKELAIAYNVPDNTAYLYKITFQGEIIKINKIEGIKFIRNHSAEFIYLSIALDIIEGLIQGGHYLLKTDELISATNIDKIIKRGFIVEKL